ncbi:MAG: hypothetical protein BWY65_02092 [Firmicutes bacterium ADurb.Bin373]|nr:MAG: hypothetical protein BWY65_02092 [Firmicutes bacterium ADurb.Bin373]
MLYTLWPDRDIRFAGRVEKFTGLVEVEKPSVESLAQKYRVQMLIKHQTEIDTKKTAHLIYQAAETVTSDITQFFQNVTASVQKNIEDLISEPTGG